jgi:ClpP class serine protease
MKPHQLLKLTGSLYTRPHLINQAGFNAVSAYLNARNKAGLMIMPEDMEMEEPDGLDDFDPEMGIGVINIYGALTYKPMDGMCGAVGCSYEEILEQAEEMIESGAKILVLNCDSGGGEGYGVFECSMQLRKMADDAGVEIYAYNDGDMASACYALACVADQVISNPYAESGSIGVLICLVNDSKHLEEEGYTRSFISAGASKIPFAEDGSWREGFLEDLQTKVDYLYGEFCAHVSMHTGLSTQDVKATEAKMFSANEALSLGLINKIMTRSEFVDFIVSKQKGALND